ncbi:MAG: hypothetical protein WCY10_06395, partial [Candidatus Omnitrophota bacterium]
MIFDLKRISRDWKPYVFLALLSLLAHVLLFIKTGANVSTDFLVRYDPIARQIYGWITGLSDVSPALSGYQIFHAGYVFLVCFIYLLFGPGNLAALIFFQVLISFVSFVLVYHIMAAHFYSRTCAVFFTGLSIVFFDNIQWATMAVPDSVFRVLFIASYYILIELYFHRMFRTYLILLPVLSVLLIVTRIDALFLLVPLYWFAFKILAGLRTNIRILSLLGVLSAVFAVIKVAGK